jgi:hypothetical protein
MLRDPALAILTIGVAFVPIRGIDLLKDYF